MTRPHRWIYSLARHYHCERCHAGSHSYSAIHDCPVVTPSDAFDALAWVLGQVWRAIAWRAVSWGVHVEYPHGKILRLQLKGNGLVVERCVREGSRTITTSGPEYIDYWSGAESTTAALDMIERLGDG